MYDWIKINICIHDLITIAVLYLVYDLAFIDIHDLTSVNELKNDYKCIGYIEKHKRE